MRKNDYIRQTLSENLSGLCIPRDMRASLFKQIVGGKKMKRKLTAGLICAIVLALLTVTALAVTAVNAWLNSVSQMQVDGTFFRWDLGDKLRFVEAMREAGYPVEEGLYKTLAGTSLEEKIREDAADKIIDSAFGDAMREYAGTWAQVPDTVVGMAPDPVIIFKQAFYLEHPGTTEQAYRDALEYWIRDTARLQKKAQEALGPTPKPQYDEAYAINSVKMAMTERYSWSQEAADGADISVILDEAHGVWMCTGSVKKESLAGSFDPLIDGPYVEDLGDSYGMHILVDKNGRYWGSITLEEYLVQSAAEPVWNYTNDQCEEIAVQGVMNRFALSAEQAGRYFIRSQHFYTDSRQYAVVRVLFKEHSNNNDSDWTYAAIVSAGTGELLDCFDAAMLWDRLPAFAQQYPQMTGEEQKHAMLWYTALNPEGGYREWTEEHKAQWDALFGE